MKNRFDMLLPFVTGRKVLDIGCVNHTAKMDDPNWLHGWLKKKAAKLVGLDYEMAEVNRMHDAGYDVKCADAESFNIHERFDCIVAGELIEHLMNPGKFLECVKAHLEQDGKLILTTPNAMSMRHFLQALIYGAERQNADHSLFFTARTLSKLLDKAGFKIERVDYFHDVVYPFNMDIPRWIMDVLHRAALLIRPEIDNHLFIAVSIK